MFRQDLPKTNTNDIVIIDDQYFNFIGFYNLFDD